MKARLPLAAAVALTLALLSTGCDMSASKDLTALQGTWAGTVKGQPHACRLAISGKNMHFEGPENGTWYDGTIALEGGSPKKIKATVTKSSMEKHAGKTAGFIYRIENGTLTLASLAPGQNAYPKGFEDPAARTFILKKGS
jgi:hypothetical protein